jgi:RNA polymerase sigma-70 factor (ECF subfamily)
MDADSKTTTSMNLLSRLRQDPADQEAWARFVERYGPKIYGWCRRWGLQAADTEDVAQDVLLKLAARMRQFVYDPGGSFRGWLKVLTAHACSDFLEARQRRERGAADSRVVEMLDSVEAREDLAQRLGEAFDEELLQEAMRLVQARVAPHTWEAFRLTTQEGLSGADAAARLQLTVARVYVAKSDVQRMLREEISRLEGPQQD